jgi:GrpB-like predicted nucleotidyltransferase (UPF0157 family)
MKSESKVMKYDRDWGEAFEKEKKNILMILGSHAVAIEHVGSTAIPRAEAKPIIAIFIGVMPFRGLSFYQSMFSLKDYSYTQTDMTDQYLFKKYENGIWTYNLHILPYNDEFYMRNEFLLRDYFRKHPEKVLEYGEVKKCLTKNGGNIIQYTRSKAGFMQKIINAARRKKGFVLQNV